MKKIVLASSSPFRADLLKKLGLAFTTARPDCDETPHPGETHRQLVMRLAENKARSIAASHGESLIIGSDQVAELDGEILGKPGAHAPALRQLLNASGRRVVFHTGLCLLDTCNDTCQVDEVLFTVQFRHLSELQIERYLQAEQPWNCAGSFRSEGLGITLFEKLEGDDPNALVGLPLIRLCD
ncbi:MAG: septum formation inhibitor Maf, partial [Gammaproteobacteria bacterium]|nr:septum formation inhibitor Maf [Gammaproteobacteria bacterium]